VDAPVRTVTSVVTVAAAAAGGVGLRAVRARHAAAAAADLERWQVITVNREPAEVEARGVARGPVADLGTRVEVATAPAAGGRGTELRVRWRDPRAGAGSAVPKRGELRLALRRTKQLVEVGEITAVGPQPAGPRPRTPTGALLDTITGRADEEGVL